MCCDLSKTIGDRVQQFRNNNEPNAHKKCSKKRIFVYCLFPLQGLDHAVTNMMKFATNDITWTGCVKNKRKNTPVPIRAITSVQFYEKKR